MLVTTIARIVNAYEREYNIEGKEIQAYYAEFIDPDAPSQDDRLISMSMTKELFYMYKLDDAKVLDNIMGKNFKIKAIIVPQRDYKTKLVKKSKWNIESLDIYTGKNGNTDPSTDIK